MRRFAPLAAALLCACGDAPDERPDQLLVTVDTLRRDHVSAYGLAFGRTPAIDALANAGAIFERHYTVVGLTEPTHVTMFSGLYPREHGVRRNGVVLPTELPLLAEILRAKGYRTGAAVGAAVLGSEFGLARGFDVFDETFDLEGGGAEHEEGYERLAEDVVGAAIDFLDRSTESRGPIFLWAHLFDPHLPHVRPVRDLPRREELEAEGAVFAAPSFLHDAERIERLRRGYAAEVRYVDAEIARLVAAWEGRGSTRRDVVVFTADHGEALGEHAYIGHSLYLYEEQLAVPLVVRAEGRVSPGTRVGSVTSVVDLGATILDLLDVAQPRDFGGTSLLRFAEREGVDPGSSAYAERPPLAGATRRLRTGKERDAEAWDPKNQQGRILKERAGQAGGAELGLVAVITPDSKYIFAEDAPDELYDLAADPDELENLASGSGIHPLRRRIDAWRAATAARYAAPKGEEAERTREMLDALGY